MLQSSTLQFLSELKDNNHKPWFDEHRKRYLAAKSDVEQFAQQLIHAVAAFEPWLTDVQAKNCMFRINRDIRFSTDKSPYKTNMGLWMAKGGKKSVFAGYYLHFEPGNSFFGGGIYMPMPPELKKVRQEIAYCFDEFQEIIQHPNFQKYYGSVVVEGHTLSKTPAGYAPDHRAAEFLKLKSYFGSCPLSDQKVTTAGLLEYVAEGIRAAAPLVAFINRALEEEESA